MGPKQQAADPVWEQPDGELVCLLCGAIVADMFGARVAHRTTCPLPLQWLNDRPRCCHCGGPLICDPTTDVWGAGGRA